MDLGLTTTEMTILMDGPSQTGDVYEGVAGAGDYLSRNRSNESLPQYFEVVNLLNITMMQNIDYAMVMFGYIMPFLCIVTIVANTLIVLVLSQKQMRSPTNLVLLAMAIADLFTLLFPAPWYFYMYTLGYHPKSLYPISACYTYYFMAEVIPAFFHTASIWLTLLLACQRYIYICHPQTAKTWCTIPRMVRATVMVFVLAFASQLSRFLDRTFFPVAFLLDGRPTLGCQVFTSEWVSVISENIYFPCYYGFRILFVNIGPCAALVVLNDLLFRALREAQRKREKLFKENRKSECKKLRETNKTTIMLIVVVSVFLLVEIPLAIATLLHVMAALDLLTVNYEYLNMCILFTNFFIIASYPVNFAIYCGMSRQFRETFGQLFVDRFKSGRRQATSSSYSTVTTAANL